MTTQNAVSMWVMKKLNGKFFAAYCDEKMCENNWSQDPGPSYAKWIGSPMPLSLSFPISEMSEIQPLPIL